MTAAIAKILKDMISGMLIVDKIAGLVTTVEKAQPTDIEGAFAVSKFPASVDSNYEDCITSGCYKDLVPNSGLKSIIYFEDLGTKALGGKEQSAYKYQTRLRLVCWLNNRLIQTGECMSINHLIITQIRELLEIGYFNEGDFKKIRITLESVVDNDYKLFDRYTYPSEAVKFLMHPYEAFGMNLSCEYSISPSCLPDFLINPESCDS